MAISNLAKFIDHTILKPTVDLVDVIELGRETLENGFASACIPPSFVKQLREWNSNITICTVISFPFGYSHSQVKLEECKHAISDGADELDIVINTSKIKDLDYIRSEMFLLNDFIHDKDKKVKWIFENSLISNDDIVNLCNLCNETKPDYAKTSTGFGKYGARIEDVKLMKKHLNENIKIKASGGIRTIEDAKMYLDLGVSRIGTSSGIKIVS